MFEVKLTQLAVDQLEELDKPMHARVLNRLDGLKDWPNVSGARRLSGGLTGRYRIRTGDYRLQFYVEGNEIVVEKIGHRDGFY